MTNKTARCRKSLHPFLFRITNLLGQEHTIKQWCRVFYSTTSVTITLTAEHVKRSIELKGVGNPATCAMSICVNAHRRLFPHDYVGYVDWWNSRCYIYSRLNKDGLPTECHIYGHSDTIADTNDFASMLDTQIGQKKLLRYIQKNGSVEIQLEAVRPLTEAQQNAQKRRRLERDAERVLVEKVVSIPTNVVVKSSVKGSRKTKTKVLSTKIAPAKKRRVRKTLGGYGHLRRFAVVQTSMLGVQPPAIARGKI